MMAVFTHLLAAMAGGTVSAVIIAMLRANTDDRRHAIDDDAQRSWTCKGVEFPGARWRP